MSCCLKALYGVVVKRLQLRHLLLFGSLAIAVAAMTKPYLNVTGMCTLGPINKWHYVSLDETLAHLRNHARRSKSGQETQYSDAYSESPSVDGYPEKSLLNQIYGTERFLIKADMKWFVEGKNIDGIRYFYSPNCLKEHIPKF
jgi:hypothetical protein